MGLRMPAISSASSILTSRTSIMTVDLRLSTCLLRQGVWPNLELHYLTCRPLAALHVERRPRADGGPEPSPLPALRRVVDAAVHPLRVEPERVGYAHRHPVPAAERQQSFRGVARVNRRVRAESRSVELIDPRVVAALGTADIGHARVLRKRLGIERPPFTAMLTGGFRPIERRFAFAAIEARHVAARKCHPCDAVAIDVHPAG